MMGDNSKLEWSKFVATTVIAVAAIAAGLVQFGHSYQQSVRQPFLSKQTDLCVAAAESAARVATSVDPSRWRAAREDFWMLYQGPLVIVEDVGTKDTVVKNAMVAFGGELNELAKTDNALPKLPLSQLEEKSRALASACRDLLSSRWNVGILGWLPIR